MESMARVIFQTRLNQFGAVRDWFGLAFLILPSWLRRGCQFRFGFSCGSGLCYGSGTGSGSRLVLVLRRGTKHWNCYQVCLQV